MGRMKEITELQDIMFQTLEAMHQAKMNGQTEKYKLALSTLDLLNKEHFTITGQYFILEKTMMNYYEFLWENKTNVE